MTYSEFFTAGLDFFEKHPHLRRGQAYYIVADRNGLLEGLMDENGIIPRMIDPFYDDRKLTWFFAALCELHGW